MYLLATVHGNGTIGAEDLTGWEDVVHRQSWNLHERYNCHDTLTKAKAAWRGPRSNCIILQLDRRGSCEAIWMAEPQERRLKALLQRWHNCYGQWPIRRLN